MSEEIGTLIHGLLRRRRKIFGGGKRKAGGQGKEGLHKRGCRRGRKDTVAM